MRIYQYGLISIFVLIKLTWACIFDKNTGELLLTVLEDEKTVFKPEGD